MDSLSARPHPPRIRGFSLVEFLVVAVIILILAAMAIPNIATTLESYRLDSAVRSISGRLTDARISAVKQNRQAWLAFNPAARTYQVQTNDNLGVAINLGPAETLPRGLVFDLPPTPAEIRYDAIGRPVNVLTFVTVQLRVTRSGQVKTLRVSSTGRVTVP